MTTNKFIMEGKLYIVPTPIGNLEDITLRAIRVLKQSDLILSENTRISKKLLKHFEVNTPLQLNHMYNEHQKLKNFISKLESGKIISLITDAGTPGISDPGYLLIREAVKHNLNLECLPGATAFVPALVISSLPIHEFVFIGFLPKKKGRLTKLNSLIEENRTMVFYESPHKIISTLQQFLNYFGEERKISLSREISKIYEQIFRGTIAEVILKVHEKPIKGEIVVCVAGKQKK